tara:strand:+ start:20792 stop:21070 length:279 start_codon:yes stop_codon:yes gene_type:complete
MKMLTVLCLSLTLAACASSDDKPDYLAAQVKAHNQTAEEGDKIICKYVKDTGTFIKKKRCRTVTQIKAELEDAQRTMGNIMSGSTNSSSGEN